MNVPATSLPRRSFLTRCGGSLAALALASPLTSRLFAQTETAPPTSAFPSPPPALPLDDVRTVVSASHRDLAKVRELVDRTPLLVNAIWDVGGGDFESPLQAAAHVGQREIAEFLLSRGARLDVFAAAMLGHLSFVQAAIAAYPDAASIPGPHGFTVLHCAIRGKEPAQPVVDYLFSIGVPDVKRRPLPFIFPAETT